MSHRRRKMPRLIDADKITYPAVCIVDSDFGAGTQNGGANDGKLRAVQ